MKEIYEIRKIIARHSEASYKIDTNTDQFYPKERAFPYLDNNKRIKDKNWLMLSIDKINR